MAITDVQFTDERWLQFWQHYKGLEHQKQALRKLARQIKQSDPGLLTESAEWVADWQQSDVANTWNGIEVAARFYGSRYPELVAAQWRLESGSGKHMSGRNNPFGLKGTGTVKTTQEVVNGKAITIDDSFINFDSIDEAVRYLVERWYLDWKQHKGVNHAPNRNEAARELQRQGYATLPSYAERLIKLMDQVKPLNPTEQPRQPAKLSPGSPFSARITPHISLGEFALGQEARRFHHQYQLDTAAELAAFLERCRRQFGGKPIIITSGYRPPAVNRSVGGASGSEHLYNAPGIGAVDFYINGADIKAVQTWCDKAWPYSLGYGAPKGFVHLGIRQGRPRVRWDY